MKNKVISVIVPVYNTEKYLKRCIESILAQTYRNLEIIAVDDGSTDGSARLLETLAAGDSRLRIVRHGGNRGLFHARLTGIECAHGDYIGFVDSDDYISCDFYRTLFDKAEETHSDIVTGRTVHEDEGGNRWIHNLYHFQDLGLLEKDAVIEEYWRQEGRNFTWHTIWNKLYSRRLWDEALPFLKKQDKHLVMTEDFAFSSVLFYFAERLVSVEFGAYFYYQNAGASTSNRGSASKFRKNIGDLKTAFDFVREFVEGTVRRTEVRQRFGAWLDLYRYFWSCNIRESGLSQEEKDSLQQILSESLPDQGNRVEHPSYFYGVATPYDNRYDEMIHRINSKDIKCVSFDIYDTAVMRPFFKPTDLFFLLDKRFAAECQEDGRTFSELRIRAEEEVRREKIYCAGPKREDISLDDIYAEMHEISGIDRERLRRFQQVECEAELKFSYARRSVLNLYKAALYLGKKIYFTSDMYLGKDFLAHLLKKCGYSNYAGILVSCEENASKRTGTLFGILIEHSGFSAAEIVHVGDHWESDSLKAKAAGIEPMPYPAPVQCIQYNIPGIKATHSCCPYSEPSGSMVNFEKSLQFLGVRTALAAAANKLYDNPFISYNEWSEMNCAPKYLGYYALGMHMLGFTKWLAENASGMGYDTLLFLARDGWLPMKSYEIISRYYAAPVPCEYIRTSRKASMAWGVRRAEDLYTLYDFINADKCTPDEFAELVSPVIEGYDSAVLREMGIECTAPIGSYGTFCRLVKIIGERFFSAEKSERYHSTMSEDFTGIMKGKTACVDIGYSGRTQQLLGQLTGKRSDAFYMHINDGGACARERRAGFKIFSFYDYTPSITGGIREVLMSDRGPSCVGYRIAGEEAVPVFEERTQCYPQAFLIEQIQDSCLDFIRDFCSFFGEYLDIMDMRNLDISYPYEYFLGTLTDTDAHMFSCLEFEDDLWLGGSVSMADYWKQCISYHKIIPYYMRSWKDASNEEDLSYKLYYKNGIDRRSRIGKAMFWYVADRAVFKQKLREIWGRNRK